MRRNHIVFLRELLVTQLNFWTVFPAGFVLKLLLAGAGHAFPVGLPAVVAVSLLPLLLYLFRAKLQKPVLFLAAHAGVLAAAALAPLPGFGTRGLCLIPAAGFVLYSLYLRLHGGALEDRGLSPILAVVLAGGCLYILQYYGQGGWRYLLYGGLVLALSLYFIVTYLENYLSFLAVNESSASHIPEREMFGSGIRLAGGYTLIGAILLMSTADIAWFGRLLQILSLGLRGVLILLFRLLPKGGEAAGHTASRELSAGGMGMPMPEGEAFWLWDVLGYAVFALLLSAFCLVFWKAFRFFLQRLRENWGRGLREADAGRLFTVRDEREQLALVRRREKRPKQLPGFWRIEQQIRRLYRRRLLQAGLDTDRLRHMTARECAAELHTPPIAVIYEKARYSGQTCSPTDLKEMKAYVR